MAICSLKAVPHLVFESLVPLTLLLNSAVTKTCLLRACDRSGTGLQTDTSTFDGILNSRTFTLLNEAPRTAVSLCTVPTSKHQVPAADKKQGCGRSSRMSLLCIAHPGRHCSDSMSRTQEMYATVGRSDFSKSRYLYSLSALE